MKGDKILVMATKSESGSVLGSLSNSVFARRTSTGSGVVRDWSKSIGGGWAGAERGWVMRF